MKPEHANISLKSFLEGRSTKHVHLFETLINLHLTKVVMIVKTKEENYKSR